MRQIRFPSSPTSMQWTSNKISTDQLDHGKCQISLFFRFCPFLLYVLVNIFRFGSVLAQTKNMKLIRMHFIVTSVINKQAAAVAYVCP